MVEMARVVVLVEVGEMNNKEEGRKQPGHDFGCRDNREETDLMKKEGTEL